MGVGEDPRRHSGRGGRALRTARVACQRSEEVCVTVGNLGRVDPVSWGQWLGRPEHEAPLRQARAPGGEPETSTCLC